MKKMKLNKELNLLMVVDENLLNLPAIEIYSSREDSNHFMRRLQQRAISWNMIELAIAYGNFQYYSKALTWTLLDKNLQWTPYRKFVDKLRGLRIIANYRSSQNSIKLSTAYWAYDLRK
jgi:hypothetical protein